MKQLVESVLENLSTKDAFVFRVTCASCGTGYADKPVRFSKGGSTPATQHKKIIYEAVYEQEFNAARKTAVCTAAEHMNYCPICKRLVCNKCFLICEDLDMCRECAGQLNEVGLPVLEDVL